MGVKQYAMMNAVANAEEAENTVGGGGAEDNSGGNSMSAATMGQILSTLSSMCPVLERLLNVSGDDGDGNPDPTTPGENNSLSTNVPDNVPTYNPFEAGSDQAEAYSTYYRMGYFYGLKDDNLGYKSEHHAISTFSVNSQDETQTYQNMSLVIPSWTGLEDGFIDGLVTYYNWYQSTYHTDPWPDRK